MPLRLSVLALVAGSSYAANVGPNLANTVLLTDAVQTHNARCLDGSAQRYWIQESASVVNKTRWYIHLMGGGWCESTQSCADRAYNPEHCWIGSSNASCLPGQAPNNGIPGVTLNDTMDFLDIPSCLGARWCGGLMMNDPVTNPLTWDWNKVLVNYCDGGSFSGNNDTVTWTEWNGTTVPVYYRGFSNLQAVVDDLASAHGLQAASDLILSGDSAGGLATLWHADYFAARLPSTRVVAAPDSGYFFADPAFPSWPEALLWVASAMNSTAGLNQACVTAQESQGKDPLQCAIPQVVAPFVSTPLFIMNSMYDSALDSIVDGEGGSNASNVNRIGGLLRAHVNATVLNRPGNGAFLTACHEHCGQWAQGQQWGSGGRFDDFNVTIDGWQAVPALQEWWAAKGQGPRSVWVQDTPYPCVSCCAGGDP